MFLWPFQQTSRKTDKHAAINAAVTKPHKKTRRAGRGRDCRKRRQRKAERFNRLHPQLLLVQSSVDDGDTGIHVKPKYTDEDASTNVNKSAPAYPQPPISSAAARSKRHDNPVVREQEAALESFQKVVQLIGEQRAKVESLERRMELGIVGDGYDNIDDHELVVHQRQIFEMEDSTQAAIDALMNGEGKDARLDAILVGLNGALEVAGEEEARIEGMQEAVDEASDGVARFRGFANEAEYELGKLKDDFAQVGELLTEAIEAVESVLEEGSQPNS